MTEKEFTKRVHQELNMMCLRCKSRTENGKCDDYCPIEVIHKLVKMYFNEDEKNIISDAFDEFIKNK